MKPLHQRLSYSNVVATTALFIALGGVSFAAVRLPSGSVGTPQLKNRAVSTAKIRNGSITEAKIADRSVTTSKLADGAVTGAKVDAATLGTVPNAATAVSAQRAGRADQAFHAEGADFATEAEYLGELPAGAFGASLLAHTDIPATTSDQEWWIPVSGMGEPSHSLKDIEMLLPNDNPLYARGFVAFSWTGPSPEDTAKVYVSLHNFEQEEPFHHWEVGVTRLAYNQLTTGDVGVEFPAGARLAYKVTEKPGGEEIPALGLQTSLYLSPSP